ncbi:glycerophosphodiester phosphodiesterase family protein [Motiliproteus sp. SC1-56]|uniref:glycerophosphodiester phosphodiesterase family protein n=1 Tax=Motiliproteus sp. SC1-56 TaxID=2799565 RepID=UPI001A8C8ADE|nr:glycerophosphodiester phosphodiesterase family protein [Motiliproteus sp. SC1-56]
MWPQRLIAHRGYPSRFPENTRIGFEAAIEAGALNLEADLQLSADKVPVLFHDRNLQRLCGAQGVVHRHALEDLKSLSPFDPQRLGRRFKGVEILTLEELVALVSGHPRITLYLEIKRLPLKVFGTAAVLETVLPRLAPIAERTVLISFSCFVLRAAKARGWKRLGPVLSRWADMRRPTVQELEPEVVFLDQRRLPLGIEYPPRVPRLALYEISDPARAQALAARGSHFIETDAIGEMLAALAGSKGGTTGI